MDRKRKGLVPTPDLKNGIEQKLTQQHPIKDKHFRTQQKDVFQAFWDREKTMLEVAIETGVMRASICRYVAEWEKTDSIRLVREGFCSISGHRAGRYSTNPELWEKGGGDGR